MDKVKTLPDGRKVFFCPGCKGFHALPVNMSEGENWIYNDDPKSPSFRPSVLAREPFLCKSYILGGMIHFAAECTHGLAAQSLNLPDWPIEYNAEIIDP